MKSSLFVPMALLFLFGCVNIGGPGYSEVRYGYHDWEHRTANIVLWEGVDGSSFSVNSGPVKCSENSQSSESIRWHFDFADGTSKTGVWVLNLTCKLVGKKSIRFVYEGTGEAIVSSGEGVSARCYRFIKRLPGGDTWWSGGAFGSYPPVPDVVVLPEVMPEVAFQRQIPGCL